MFKASRALVAGGILLGVLGATPASAVPFRPDYTTVTFLPGAPIDNPYFPLIPGTLSIYCGEIEDEDTGEIEVEIIHDFVTHRTRDILGVRTTVLRAREFVDGVLVEDTEDYYAQDTDGNVWYFGEYSEAYEYDDDGNLIDTSTDGSWIAGEDDADPGWIMPGSLPIGLNYYQEYAPNNDALDQAEILATDRVLDTELGLFSNVLVTLETSEIEPDFLEHKSYAPGIGLVLIEEDFDDEGEPVTLIKLKSVSTVPEPATAGLAMLSVGALGVSVTRRRRRQ